MNSSRDLSAVRASTSDEYVCFLLSQEGEKSSELHPFVCVLCVSVFPPFSTRKAENLIVALSVHVQ